jgi:hypothetical protein
VLCRLCVLCVGFNGDFRANPVTPRPTANRDPAKQPIWERYGFNFTDVEASFKNTLDKEKLRASREYVLKNNPRVRNKNKRTTFICLRAGNGRVCFSAD